MSELQNTDIVRNIYFRQKDGITPIPISSITKIWAKLTDINDVELTKFQYPAVSEWLTIEVIDNALGIIQIVIPKSIETDLTSYVFEIKYEIDGKAYGDCTLLFKVKKSNILI